MPQRTARPVSAKRAAPPETKKYLADSDPIPVGSSPEEFAEFIKNDVARHAEIVKKIGLDAPLF